MPRLYLEFSESSYAFAFAENLIRSDKLANTSAPKFLSTYDEGHGGKHYDVEIASRPVAFFFQFKVPEVLQRRVTLRTNDRLQTPYYRMALRHHHNYSQHRGLMELESSGANVYYVCPRFHKDEDLSSTFGSGAVIDRSAWFRPSQITPKNYDGPHGVVFDKSGKQSEVRSDPRTVEGKIDFDEFTRQWEKSVTSAPLTTPKDFLSALQRQLEKAFLKAALAFERPQERGIEPSSQQTVSSIDFSELETPPEIPATPIESDVRKTVRLARELGLEILVGGI